MCSVRSLAHATGLRRVRETGASLKQAASVLSGVPFDCASFERGAHSNGMGTRESQRTGHGDAAVHLARSRTDGRARDGDAAVRSVRSLAHATGLRRIREAGASPKQAACVLSGGPLDCAPFECGAHPNGKDTRTGQRTGC